MTDPSGAVDARIEVSKGGFIKWESHAGHRIDWVSPLPCPWNYGFLPDFPAADGDPADALILGPRLPLGARVRMPVVAVIRFEDGGHPDDKWILASSLPDTATMRHLGLFFAFYAHARGVLDRLRGRRPSTRFLGIERTQIPGAP